MAQIRLPAAPLPPSQAVYARARLSLNKFDFAKSPISESEKHKLTATPHSVAFFDKRNVPGPHKGAMCVSACGTQCGGPQFRETVPNMQVLGVVADPMYDADGVMRHPEQLGSMSCGIRGLFTIAVSDTDMKEACIGDNLYINGDQRTQPSISGTIKNYTALQYEARGPFQRVFNGFDQERLVGRIVGFGKNQVQVILA